MAEPQLSELGNMRVLWEGARPWPGTRPTIGGRDLRLSSEGRWTGWIVRYGASFP